MIHNDEEEDFLHRVTNVRAQQKFRLKPTQTILLSFVLMIGLGTLLLMLPVSTTNGEGLPAMDALFLSTSASCVTGLTVVDVKNDLSFFGKCVMLMLIQVGGLGIMTLATMAAHAMGYRFQLKQSLILQESLNQSGRAGLFGLIRRMIIYTLVVEGFFALLLTWHLYPELGFDAVGYGKPCNFNNVCIQSITMNEALDGFEQLVRRYPAAIRNEY